MSLFRSGNGRARTRLAIAAALACLLLTGCRPRRAPPGTTLVYRLALPDGAAPSDAQMGKAAEIASKRLSSRRCGSLSIVSDRRAGRLEVTIPSFASQEVAQARALLERAGTLEFRILADRETEQKARDARQHGAAGAPPPSGFAWVPLREAAGESRDTLVQVPEAPLAAELAQLERGDAPDAAAFAAMRSRLANTLRTEVFTGSDLAGATVKTQGASVVVAFEIEEDRKSAFCDFTRLHVGRQLAIVLDGKVDSAPVIRSELPGHGIIEGGGAGFTEAEARELCSVLTAGSFPGRLMLVGQEPPAGAGR